MIGDGPTVLCGLWRVTVGETEQLAVLYSSMPRRETTSTLPARLRPINFNFNMGAMDLEPAYAQRP